MIYSNENNNYLKKLMKKQRDDNFPLLKKKILLKIINIENIKLLINYVYKNNIILNVNEKDNF